MKSWKTVLASGAIMGILNGWFGFALGVREARAKVLPVVSEHEAQAKLCSAMPTIPPRTIKTPCRFVANGYTVLGFENLRCDAPEKGCGP
jgi:hypothetical protein